MPRIVVSLSQRRLYLFEGSRLIRSYPVGIGRIASRTPTGRYTIINKVPYPYSWPGGPLSAYGTLWMGLSRPGYGSTEPTGRTPSDRWFPGDASACTTRMWRIWADGWASAPR